FRPVAPPLGWTARAAAHWPALPPRLPAKRPATSPASHRTPCDDDQSPPLIPRRGARSAPAAASVQASTLAVFPCRLPFDTSLPQISGCLRKSDTGHAELDTYHVKGKK